MQNSFLPWSSFTREERFFCSHLYHSILGKEKEFVKWLNETLKPEGKLKLDASHNWELSFEVCFYRDFIKANGKTIKAYNKDNSKYYPPKRTFDLCLFSKSEMVIIEAKVQQGFSRKQIEEMKQDKKLVKNLLEDFNYPVIKVETILLFSSEYKPREESIIKYPFITWENLNLSPFKCNNLFELADRKFRR